MHLIQCLKRILGRNEFVEVTFYPVLSNTFKEEKNPQILKSKVSP